MKAKIYFVSLFTMLMLLACSNVLYAATPAQVLPASQQTVGMAAQMRVVKTSADFLKTYQGWIANMEDIATKTNASYNDLQTGKIDRKTFNDKISKLYQQMRSLNMETDSWTNFDLSSGDKSLVNYSVVTKEWQIASKYLNNFLWDNPYFGEDSLLKEKYNDYNLNYNKYLSELKKDLKIK